MYQCGEQVLYGIHGVCRIVALEKRLVDRKQVEYYVLEPVDQAGARFYVPTHNQAAVAKLRRVLSLQELTQLLQSEAVQQNAWIEDEGKRRLYYRDLICSGNRAALISMVHSLHRHKEAQAAAGKKFHQCDENFLRDAEKLLDSEFSLVLKIPQEQVAEYVCSVLQGNEI
ncbi:MAG: hypothetical protein J6Q53_08450 [Oscillospiraceae bacterium]|nr:hypothetical protein [Oscillospiraceae bacterium]